MAMITQVELARLAGVSQKTVNRALSNHPDVNANTRKQILRIAENNGYMPNQAACAVRSGRYGNIGMIVPEHLFSSYLPQELIIFLKKSLHKHDLNLLISCMTDKELLDDTRIKSILQRMMCDGILINYDSNTPPLLHELLNRFRIPAIWLNNRMEYNCIYHDEHKGGRDATDYLLKLGHQRIAYINYNGIDHHSRVDRRDGYMEAMRNAGLTPEIYENSSIPAAERYLRIKSILQQPCRPSAIIAYLGDLPILGSICKEMSIAIPTDLSVITFDVHPASFADIRFTTVVQNEQEFCDRTVAALLSRIEISDNQIGAIKVESNLHESNSTCEIQIKTRSSYAAKKEPIK